MAAGIAHGRPSGGQPEKRRDGCASRAKPICDSVPVDNGQPGAIKRLKDPLRERQRRLSIQGHDLCFDQESGSDGLERRTRRCLFAIHTGDAATRQVTAADEAASAHLLPGTSGGEAREELIGAPAPLAGRRHGPMAGPR